MGSDDTGSERSRGVAGRLVAELEADAELVAEGEFSFALERAGERLSKLRVADPQRFVLLLVEAAHLLSGCRRVSVALSEYETRVVLEGATLSREHARAPLDGLFRSSAAKVSGLGFLAAGVNAMLGIEHRGVSLELSTSDGGVVHIDLSPGSDGPLDSTLEESELGSSPPSLILSIRERGAEAGQRRRRELLRTCCAHASLPVRVDGERVDRGSALVGAVDRVEVCEGDRSVAHGGWPEEGYGRHAELRFVANGVVVETVVRDDWRPGFVGLIEAGDLQRDLSLAKLVRDQVFEERVDRLRRAHETVPDNPPLRYEPGCQHVGVAYGRLFQALGASVGGFASFLSPVVGISISVASLAGGELWQRVIVRGRFDRIKREGRRAVGFVCAVKPNEAQRVATLSLDLEPEDAGGPRKITLVVDFPARVRSGQRVYLRICARDPSVVLLATK